ncbi:MAG TPA: ABC transporter substrate-binding protein [Acidimicrobiales bacterium]|nr:ABC transporter substrate-binding protein [Acidimicrobiales bacterium]
MTNTYDRRQFLTHSAAAAGGVVAAGAVAGELGFADAAGAITMGGTLTMGVISEQNKPFNPAHANMDTSGFCYGRAIYDPLMVVGADGLTVFPYLAASLKPNKTYTQWTITARPGIKFSNSTPCNGDAIYANMHENFVSTLTGPAVQALIAGFTHTPGSNTVVVHTKHPWVTFPFTLAEQQISFIAEPSTLGATYSGKPIGTGPFTLNTWNYSTSFSCDKNPQYWRAGLPYLDHIVFKPIPDGPTRFAALKSGALDIIHEGEGDILKQFAGLGGGYTWTTDYPGRPKYSPSSNCIMMNTSKAPFTNINMRKGCAYALDQTQYVKTVESGFSSPINGIFLPGSPYYKSTPYPKYNVATAKKYIAKVPKSQRSFTLTYVAGSPAVLTDAQLTQQFLQKVGVTVTLNGVTQGQLIGDAIFGAFQALTWSQFGGVSPDLNHPWFQTKPPGGGTWLNFARNQDPKIESLMLAGMAAKSTTARKNAWAAVNIRINQDIPYLWTDRAVTGVAAHSNVQNWKTFQDPSGHQVLQPNQAVLFFTTTWKS